MKWKSRMSENDQRLADFIAGRAAKITGYEQTFKAFSFRAFFSYLGAWFYLLYRSARRFLISRLPFSKRLEIHRSNEQ